MSRISLHRRIRGLRWKWAKKRFGIWGVRNYYSLLELMASEGAKVSFGYLLMILAAALLATSGLLLDSAVVIVGAMCVAPFLGPSRAVCIGAIFRNRKLFLGGLIKQILGLFVICTATAYFITILLRGTVPGVVVTKEILLRAMPTTRDLVLSILVAVGSGAAASLALTADPRIVAHPWGQIIDAMIGVEIAISLIPPASVIGIGLAFMQLNISLNAFWLLIVNILGLNFLGSILMLTLRGVRLRYLVLEKAIRQTVNDKLAETLDVSSQRITANVVLLSETTVDVQATVYKESDFSIPQTLAQGVTSEIEAKTGYRSKVTIEIIPLQVYSTLQLNTPHPRWSK